jgi:hypothetical protein
MADLGGISFPIKTEYDGSGVQTFIADLAFAREAFAQFRAELAAGASTVSKFTSARKGANDEERKAAAELKARQKALRDEINIQNERLAIARKLAESAARESKANGAAALAANTKQTAQNLGQAQVQASLLSGTIVRMLVFRQIVQFIREGVGLFKEFVKSGVEYDATIEKTRLGIAGLLDSIANIKDAQGNTLSGAEKFQESVAISTDLMSTLSKEALRTGVSVEELGKIFQQALGPGLQAGLKLDEVAKLTGEISIAASALGVSENRIAHELRDITTGHIRSATDRIGTALGINADDIKRAKEAGTLFDFLQQKFIGFNAVAAEAPKTFDGIVSRLKVTSEIISGIASTNLFNELKKAGSELLTTLQGPNNPRITQILQNLLDVFTNLVKEAREFVEGITFDQLETASKNVAAAMQTVIDLLVGVGKGVGDVVGSVLDLAGAVGGTHQGLRDSTEEATKLYLTFKLISPIAATLAPIITSIALAVLKSTTAMQALGAATRVVGTFLGGLIIPVALVVAGVQEIFALFGGGIVSVKEFAIAMEFGFKNAILQAQVLTTKFKGLTDITDEAKQKTADALGDLQAQIAANKDAEARAFAAIIDTGAVAGSKEATAKIIAAAKAASDSYLEGLRNNIRPGVAGVFDDITKGILDSQQKLITALGGTATQKPLAAQPHDVTAVKKDLTEQQVDTIAKEKEETALLNEQAFALRSVTAERAVGVAVSTQQIEATRGQTRELEAQIAVQKKADKLARDKLEAQLTEVSDVDRQKALAAFDEQHNAALDVQVAKREQINQLLLEENNRAGNNGARAAFDQLAIDITSKLPNAIEAATTIAKTTVTEFASFVSDAIIAAFDPNNKESLIDRFKQFLSGILKQVIQMLTQIAITKAILGDPASNGGKAGGLVGIIGSLAAAASAAQGGLIRSPHSYARGYASGGDVRPNWVDRRDTVAAWLQPGEFVMPLGAVRKYGLAVMDSMRRGSVAPRAVQAAAGFGAGSAAAPPSGASLAGGGVASSVAGAQARNNSTPTPAFIVADDHSVDALLRGGRGAVLRFMRENADAVYTAIRRTRPSR